MNGDQAQGKGQGHGKGRKAQHQQCAHVANEQEKIEDLDVDVSSGTAWTAWIAEIDDPNITLKVQQDPGWFLDSGTTTHICRDAITFHDYEATPGGTIRGIGGQAISKTGEGTIQLQPSKMKCPHKGLILAHTVHVLAATYNLVSVS